MTQTTNTDIREIKSTVEAIDRRIESITKATEANTKATEANTKATEANAKAITDLTLEMRLGFANVDTKFSDIRGDIKALESKFEERTKGFGQRLDGKELFQRNASVGLITTIVGGILLALAKVLFGFNWH